MKQAMKEMLQEFIERDFTAEEMTTILGSVRDVEQNYKLLGIYRKRKDLDHQLRQRVEIRDDMQYLRDRLDDVSLSYECDDLVDNGGVEL